MIDSCGSVHCCGITHVYLFRIDNVESKFSARNDKSPAEEK